MITGTLRECLQHYCQQLPYEKRKVFADFAGVVVPTTTRWMNGDPEPGGVIAMKVRALLTHLGYVLTDTPRRHPSLERLEELLAFGVLTMEQILKQIGTTQARLLCWIRGQEPMGDGIAKIEELEAIYSPSLETHRSKYLDLFFADSDEIVRLSLMIQQMLPLAERVTSDAFSSQQRSKLRELAGDGRVFKLYNVLGQLCGERARSLTRV